MSGRESLVMSGLNDSGRQTVIKVYLVNGESRSLSLDQRTEVTVSPLAAKLSRRSLFARESERGGKGEVVEGEREGGRVNTWLHALCGTVCWDNQGVRACYELRSLYTCCVGCANTMFRLVMCTH